MNAPQSSFPIAFLIATALLLVGTEPLLARDSSDSRPTGNLSATLPIALSASDSARSTTKAGISGATITITDETKQQERTGNTAEQTVASLNRDVATDRDTTNALTPIFDQQEIEAGFAIVGALGREVGTFLENRAKETTKAEADLKAESAKPEAERDQARIAALAQTLEDNQTWAIGGTGRTLLTALTLAASGNVTGSGTQLLQSATVNYLQGLATEQVKELADSLDSDTARTAFQGLVACTGAAAQNQSCGTAAGAAAASVVLNNLLDQIDGHDGANLSAEDKEARKNLVATLITGITAEAGGNAAIANAAAQIETEHTIGIVVLIANVSGH